MPHRFCVSFRAAMNNPTLRVALRRRIASSLSGAAEQGIGVGTTLEQHRRELRLVNGAPTTVLSFTLFRFSLFLFVRLYYHVGV